ncbi:MAG: 3-isopropylmalate dehydratase, partial [Rhodobacteraceae bacterium]|nr:3-isopropylmalate dehydratase [Paracoccaceae bacterium]
MPANMTLAEKIIARAAGRPSVRPGEVVTAKVDLAMIHDSGGPRRVEPVLKRLGAGLWDKDRVVLFADHYVGDPAPESNAILELTRRWATEKGVKFYDGEGICHVVLPQKGYLSPGMFVVGGDSHSPTGGAFGAYMFGIGATEMAGVLATGEIWIKVPETILVEWRGQPGPGITAKDMMLALCGKMGMDGGRYQAVQYQGETISAMNMAERMTLSNMTAELGGQAGLIAPDQVTLDYIIGAGGKPGPWPDLTGDSDAVVAEHHSFDSALIVPQVAAPHSPANAAPVDTYRGQ